MTNLKSKILWLAIFTMMILVAGCSSKDVASKEASTDRDRLTFSSETIAAGEKLPNVYENKDFNYSIRYSDSWKKPQIDEDRIPYWGIKDEAGFWVGSNVNVVALKESDPVSRKMSDPEFMKVVLNSLKGGDFSELKVTRSLKKVVGDEVWFFFEYEGKFQGTKMYFQQYYLDNGSKIIILTSTFGKKEEQTKFNDEMQAMMSSLKVKK